MNREPLLPLVSLTLLIVVPAVLVVYPISPRGTFVVADYQLTRAVVLQAYFTVPVTVFVVYSAYRVFESSVGMDDPDALGPSEKRD